MDQNSDETAQDLTNNDITVEEKEEEGGGGKDSVNITQPKCSIEGDVEGEIEVKPTESFSNSEPEPERRTSKRIRYPTNPDYLKTSNTNRRSLPQNENKILTETLPPSPLKNEEQPKTNESISDRLVNRNKKKSFITETTDYFKPVKTSNETPSPQSSPPTTSKKSPNKKQKPLEEYTIQDRKVLLSPEDAEKFTRNNKWTSCEFFRFKTTGN
jgi:hypothetical protein